MTSHVVDLQDATTGLWELVRRAEAGDDVILALDGRPVAKIVPWSPARPMRVPGAWAGRVHVVGDLVGSDHDIEARFTESSDSSLPAGTD